MELLKTSKNVYITCVCNNPKNSNYVKRSKCKKDTLRVQLSKFSFTDMVFIGGDFNSKTRTQNDFIIENKKVLSYVLQRYELDTIRSVSNKFV